MFTCNEIQPVTDIRPNIIVYENRILVQMGPSPIQSDKWTEINK